MLPIKHNKPTIGPEEIEAATRVLESAHLAAGSEVEAFEKEFVDQLFNGEGYAIAVSSGSAALKVAFLSWKDACNWVSAVPVYSCDAVIQAILQTNGTFILLDSKTPEDWVINLHRLYANISCVIVIHPFGMVVPITDWPESLVIVEDCSQAIGSCYYDGSSVGSKGFISTFSLSPTKPITCGGYGGVVYSKQDYFNEIGRYRIEYDRSSWDHREVFNFKMSDVNAAIARVQLRRLDSFVKRRKEIYEKYTSVLTGGYYYSFYDPDNHNDIMYHRALFRVVRGIGVDITIKVFKEHGIEVIKIIEPEELQTKKWAMYPNALNLCSTTISLPLYPSLTDFEVERVCLALEDCIERSECIDD